MNPLVSGPILGTLLGLTWPNMVAMGWLMFVGVAETWIVGQLGLTSLAAISLVFPSIILMQTLAGGSIGGSVAALVSQELGRGRPDEASVVAFHGQIVAVAFGLTFFLLFQFLGPSLYALIGGKGEVLAIASRYSMTVFIALPIMWWWMTLAGVLRGAGNMRLPARMISICAVSQILLGAALGLGLGPLPSLGMVGVGLGQVIPNVCAAAFGFWYVASGRAAVRFKLDGRLPALRRDVFVRILKIGVTSCMQPLQSMLIVMIVGRLVAVHGVEALAAYGVGARLEILLMNLVWAVGVASVPMIGMSLGAGRVGRSRTVAWTTASVAGAILLCVGCVLALMPDLWLGLFTSDPTTLVAGRHYLHRVGPCLVFLGVGGALYFSSQAAGRVLGPVLASSVRLLIILGGGMWLQSREASIEAVFMLIGVAMVAYGICAVLAVRFTPWGVEARSVSGPHEVPAR